MEAKHKRIVVVVFSIVLVALGVLFVLRQTLWKKHSYQQAQEMSIINMESFGTLQIATRLQRPLSPLTWENGPKSHLMELSEVYAANDSSIATTFDLIIKEKLPNENNKYKSLFLFQQETAKKVAQHLARRNGSGLSVAFVAVVFVRLTRVWGRRLHVSAVNTYLGPLPF